MSVSTSAQKGSQESKHQGDPYRDEDHHDATFCHWRDPNPPYEPEDAAGQFAIMQTYRAPPENSEERERRREDWQYPEYEDLEDPTEYRPGGYCPVTIGMVLNGQYTVVDKLGYGYDSTVWRVNDSKGADIALKIFKATVVPAQGPEVMEKVDSSHFALPLQKFTFDSANGTHHCFTMQLGGGDLERIMGERRTALGLELATARTLCVELMEALGDLHREGVVHGDLNLSNVLLRSLPRAQAELLIRPYTEPLVRRDRGRLGPGKMTQVVYRTDNAPRAEVLKPDDCPLMICDFGCASFSGTRLGKDYQGHDDVRCPESLWVPEAPLTLASDIWSLGVLMWRLMTNINPFGHDPVLQQLEILGPRPSHWRKTIPNPATQEEQFRAAALGLHFPETPTNTREQVRQTFERHIEAGRHRHTTQSTEKMTLEERDAFTDIIMWMWQYEPDQRAGIYGVRYSEWTSNWGRPSPSSSVGSPGSV